VNALPLLEFCSRDATTLRITYAYGGGCEELTVASPYLPYDSDEPPPTKEVKDITDYCHSRKKQLIIGCDGNAHHTVGKHWHQLKRSEPIRNSGEFEPEYS
jgi:hypothetical protein